MAKKKILVVEDDRDISQLIAYHLEREGYEVACLYDGSQVVDFVHQRKPQLIILDLMLPQVDGIDICRTLKSDPYTKHIPLVMLTAKNEEADVVVGLQMGADDYIPKPFSPKILMARLKAIMRRTADSSLPCADHVRNFKDFNIDLLKHRISYKGREVKLTSLEFDIIEFLSRSPGRVWSREQILDNVWKEGKFIIDRAIDVHVRGLRKKLKAVGHYIETVRGVGYRFKDVD